MRPKITYADLHDAAQALAISQDPGQVLNDLIAFLTAAGVPAHGKDGTLLRVVLAGVVVASFTFNQKDTSLESQESSREAYLFPALAAISVYFYQAQPAELEATA